MSKRVYVATRKGLFTIDRNGSGTSAWKISRAQFLGDIAGMVAPDLRGGSIYLSIGHGHFGSKMHRSSDEGKSWEEIAVPQYPPKPEGLEDVDPVQQKPNPWKLEQIWALAASNEKEPGAIWCGTIPGGLFKSADRGNNWEMIRPLWDHPKRKEWFGGGAIYPGIHSICVHPKDPHHVSVGVSCGGVWVTENGGETWDLRATGMRAAYMPPDQAHNPAIQDPHCVVQCAAEPKTLWAQHHNGIFKTTDGGQQWEEIETAKPSNFGFATAVHPKNPNIAWFVPGVSDEKRIPVDGKVVVSRTSDGGKTFEVFRKGLPQENAYDIVFRHALDVDETGGYLAFGSTTGSLWISDDGGESWQTVSNHLPQVYCVRFAK